MARRRVRRIVPPIVFGTVCAGVVPMVATSCDSSGVPPAPTDGDGEGGDGDADVADVAVG